MFMLGQPQRQTYPRIAATGTAAVHSAFFACPDRAAYDRDMRRFDGDIDGDQGPFARRPDDGGGGRTEKICASSNWPWRWHARCARRPPLLAQTPDAAGRSTRSGATSVTAP